MTLVVDAGVVVAALADSGPLGAWCEEVLRNPQLVSPHHMPAEVTNILRRTEANGALSADAAALAMRDLATLPVQLVPFEPCAGRVWTLRENVTAYDAWYVAIAEALRCPLATLDRRLAQAPGPWCEFLLPPH